MKTVIILGAPDPEMQAIEQIAKKAGAHVVCAVDSNERRVVPMTAYKATGTDKPIVDRSAVIIAVECEVAGVTPTFRVDHHRNGDTGYGKPPAEYWQASSIGQVVLALGIEPTDDEMEEYRLVAAADHCLAAAYRGECPGVDPERLMKWRIATRAAFQRRDPAALMADVEATREALRNAKTVILDRCVGVRDMRRDEPWPELPEAAAREGLGYLAGPFVCPDGRRKYTCTGARIEVMAFMESWAELNHLVDVYGDPERGFAGGYTR